MTVILLHDSSHEALRHLVGMPNASLWAVLLGTDNREGRALYCRYLEAS